LQAFDAISKNIAEEFTSRTKGIILNHAREITLTPVAIDELFLVSFYFPSSFSPLFF
jgi:hypothetical protein